ncbi:LexA family transcriptional regulator [Parathalassolituus penaei]|uniref:Helix-turn-helix domain-containing protein n=1 Tax=Parathalassolituus penaei TaxID=2997323 RepID=A0A9X3EFW1_9GAMM|nr:S24 family peptidase [Parathalassolituus penaei]MCY0966491.1 helix-turn-helix domain-containing protein [Parathalassolituus penaei]
MTTHPHADQDPLSPGFLQALGRRIAVMAELVGSKKRLADAAGISESQLYRCIKGSSATTIEPLVAMAMAAGVSIEWLVLGRGEMKQQGSFSGNHATDTSALIAIGDLDANSQHAPLAVTAEWLNQQGLQSNYLHVTTVSGDIMAPTCNSGDLLMIDTNDIQLREGHIFVLRSGGQTLIRRIQIAPSKGLWLMCDNTRYQPTILPNDSLTPPDVVGRVVWIGQSI